MAIEFTRYQVERTKATGKDISIIKRGGFGLSANFVSKNIPDRPKHVALNYAQDIEYIYVGFSFSKEKKKDYLTINYPKGKNGLLISSGFFKKYGIDAKKYFGSYPAEEHNDNTLGKMFVIKIKK